MGKSKIIFLDIDGVLNSEKFYVKRMSQKKDEYVSRDLDEEAIALLNQLEGASVVVSSSWGENGGKTSEQLNESGLRLPILGYTKKVHYQFKWACRGNEIEEWLESTYGGMGTCFGDAYADENYDYVIFDDDSDMLLGQINHFVHVDRSVGLTQADIDKA